MPYHLSILNIKLTCIPTAPTLCVYIVNICNIPIKCILSVGKYILYLPIYNLMGYNQQESDYLNN